MTRERGARSGRSRWSQRAQVVLLGRRVLADGRHALGLGLPVRGDRGGHRGGRHDDQHRRHGRLRACRTSSANLIARRSGATCRNIDKAVISVHCHDDLGLAVANSLAAIKAGARQVECSINGIGERAGNASLEEVVMALQVAAGLLQRRRDADRRDAARGRPARCWRAFTGQGPQPNKAIVGHERLRARVGHPPGRRAEGHASPTRS